MIVTLPALAPVRVTEQAADTSVHLAGLGRTLPGPLCEKVTVPVGESPETRAVQIVEEPEETGEGEQLTNVVEAVLSDITDAVPDPSFVTKTSPLAGSYTSL